MKREYLDFFAWLIHTFKMLFSPSYRTAFRRERQQHLMNIQHKLMLNSVYGLPKAEPKNHGTEYFLDRAQAKRNRRRLRNIRLGMRMVRV